MEWEKSGLCSNSHTIGCDALCRRQHYCVCVNFLKAVEDGRIGESFLDCQRAVRNGNCVAFKMREEEKSANAALYYTKRKAIIRVPVDRPLAPSKPKTKSVVKKSMDEMMIGSDVTAGIRADVRTLKADYPKPKFGEDLLTFALRFKKYESQSLS